MVFLSQVTGPSCFLGKPVFYGRMKKMWVPPGLRPKRPSFQQLGREVSLLEVDGEDYLPCDVNMSGLYELPKTLEVVKYPDPRLRKENEEVDPCHPSVGEIARKMFQVMYADRGVGLAAPQVGINQRLMVYNPTGKPSSFLSQVVMVNPKIVDCSDKKVVDLEGCLSFPGIAGKKIKLKLEGWQARIFQHEYDHLDGILFIDRMEPEERARAQFVLDQLVNNYKGNGIPQL
ncbi:Peptide deformylase 1B, chloroplastic/mitochondrial [Galdieria sulphuraria]|nr:Peptide deformylase 1B, chloroplastic/mitochondrial [Galdieria sulphuraria]